MCQLSFCDLAGAVAPTRGWYSKVLGVIQQDGRGGQDGGDWHILPLFSSIAGVLCISVTTNEKNTTNVSFELSNLEYDV